MKKHSLPDLPFAFDALEPYMDAKTLEIHWGKHHRTYVDKLNLALEKHPALFDKPIEELLAHLDKVPEDIRTAVRNAGGGHANHSLLWDTLSPNRQSCSGKLLKAIEKDFGSFDDFRKQFSEKSLALFGSGYVWLVVDSKTKKLEITCTGNQDTPLSVGKRPILLIDLWEHSYYVKHLWNRSAYVDAWWNIVNWFQVEKNYVSASK